MLFHEGCDGITWNKKAPILFFFLQKSLYFCRRKPNKRCFRGVLSPNEQIITQAPCVFLSPNERMEQREQSQIHLSYAEPREQRAPLKACFHLAESRSRKTISQSRETKTLDQRKEIKEMVFRQRKTRCMPFLRISVISAGQIITEHG